MKRENKTALERLLRVVIFFCSVRRGIIRSCYKVIVFFFVHVITVLLVRIIQSLDLLYGIL